MQYKMQLFWNWNTVPQMFKHSITIQFCSFKRN
jgi:hypothetical protein